MKHYYFIENESGEEFIVGAHNLHEACKHPYHHPKE